jgi:peptidoglycan/LPS O-acetylase OafA/YrhL
MTMFQYYLHFKDLDMPYWTMIIEMLFYMFMFTLYKFNLLKTIVIIGCLVNVIIVGNYLLVSNGYIPNLTSYFPLVNHFALFFAGILFYKIIKAN